MSNIKIISGSPCSGKNTYIQRNKEENDLVWDFDKIHNALTDSGSHQHIEKVRKYIFSMRENFYEDLKTETDLRVWIINSSPLKNVRDYFVNELKAEIIFLQRSQDDCLEVAKNERPDEWIDYVNSYFERLEMPLESENTKIITIERDHIPGHDSEEEIEEDINEEEEEELEDEIDNYNLRQMKKINVWDEKHTQETRFFEVETRLDSKGKDDIVIGHAAVFNSLSEDLGGFKEKIMPGAFDSVLKNDTRAYFNHDPNFLLGRVSAGTLRLSVDEIGLRYELDIPKTNAGQDLKENLRNGNITQSSFAFTLPSEGGDTWERDDNGQDVRLIHKIDRLWDVSPVSLPAYNSANDLALAHRSFYTSKENKRKEGENEFELNLLNLKINLLKRKK